MAPSQGQRDAADRWLSLLESGALAGERGNYLRFAKTVLADILGYPIDDLLFESDRVEFQYRGAGTGSKDPVVCFEVKGALTGDLFAPQRRAKMEHYTPVKQLWDYMGSTGASYGICSNYRRFVLLARETGTQRHHEFDFEEIKGDPAKLEEFIGVFSRAAIEGGIVGRARGEAADEERELTGEFYDLYGRTRLMLIREFESCGAERDDAVSAAQLFLNRLIFIFFVEDSDMVGEKDVFADGVIDQLHTRLSLKTSRVWRYICTELFAWFDGGSDDPRIAAFNGGLFSATIDPRLSFPDRRRGDFFADIGPGTGRQSWVFKEKIEKAVRRHKDVNPVVKNLLALSSYDYASQIRVSILGHVFEHSITDLEDLVGKKVHARKRGGVYYTPGYVTRYICRRTILPHLSRLGTAVDPATLVAEYADDLDSLDDRLARIRVLDPACGSGAFLIEAAATLLDVHREIRLHRETNGDMDYGTLNPAIDDARIREIVRDNIYGIDINAQSVEITRLSLFLLTATRNESLPDLSRNIVTGDSVSEGGLDWEGAFPGVFSGEIPGFSVIVGNPPYVRHEDVPTSTKGARTRPPKNARAPPLSPRDGFDVPKTSDLGCYFYYRSLGHLAEGGRLGFISSDGWMHSDYGQALQRAILDNAEIASIVVPAFRVFGDADVNTAVVLLRRGRPARGGSVELARARSVDDFARMRPDSVSRVVQGTMEPGNWNALFQGAVAKPSVPLLRMDEVGTVRRGVVTGHKDFFVLDRDAVAENSIDPEYVCPLVVGGESPVLDDDNATLYLFNANVGKGSLARKRGGAAVLRYIQKGEQMEAASKAGGVRSTVHLPDLPTMSTRRLWYSLGLDRSPPPPIFLSRIVNDRIKVHENSGTYRAINTFVSYCPKVASDTHALLAYFASSWFALHLERNANPMGGGALSVEVRNFNAAPVPDLRALSAAAASRLDRAWLAYCETLDQVALDDEVLGVLGFADADRASIRAELAELVAQRTARKRASPGTGNE